MACSAMRSPKSVPEIDTTEGKFSTFGLQVIWPPSAAFSKMRTLLPARRAYTAAVSPAGPPPITMISYMTAYSFSDRKKGRRRRPFLVWQISLRDTA